MRAEYSALEKRLLLISVQAFWFWKATPKASAATAITTAVLTGTPSVLKRKRKKHGSQT